MRMAGQEMACGAGNARLLLRRNRFGRMAAIVPRLDFDKGQAVATAADQINFANRAAVAPCQNPITLQRQGKGACQFGQMAQAIRPAPVAGCPHAAPLRASARA